MIDKHGLLPVRERIMQFSVGNEITYRILESLNKYFESEHKLKHRQEEKLAREKSDMQLELRDQLLKELEDIEKLKLSETDKSRLRRKINEKYEKKMKRHS